MTIDAALGWRNQAALDALVRAVTDPKSQSYGQYLSPAQFHAKFSPSEADAAAAGAWLRSGGLKVGAGPASRLWVSGTGTVGQIQKLLGVTINRYKVNGHVLRAPESAPAIPHSLSGVVKGFVGLTDLYATATRKAPPPPGFVVGTPCSEYWNQLMAKNMPPAYGEMHAYTPCGYTPQQIRGAYGVADAIKGGNNGQGVTVAIIDAFLNPTLVSDLETYSENHNLPAPKIRVKQFHPYQGDRGNQQGWYGEQALDLDAVHSMAPAASLVFVGASDNRGNNLNAAMAWVLDNHAADETSNSYGYAGEQLGQHVINVQENMFKQAAAEGIGTYFSSGDSGDEIDNLGFRTTDYPASSANVTAVGGTSLGVDANKNYYLETGWGTRVSNLAHKEWTPAPPGDFLYGGGGGTSRVFSEPWYQVPVVPSDLVHYFGGNGRVVPDVAAVGDPNTGFTIGITQKFFDGTRYGEYRIGGTSLSAPLMAGIMALAQQRAHQALGFINPALYQAYQANPGIVHDVVDPSTTIAVVRTNFVNGQNDDNGKAFSLRTMNQTGTLHTKPGYDDVTGVGTPNGEAYLDAFKA
jgi:subtilase family serine protease